MNLKTPITYYGGKQSMLRHILPLVPKHKIYTESFCGGAALYWAKEPALIEVINDVNTNVINFYSVLKNSYSELKKKIDATLHSRKTHDYAVIVYEFPEFFEPLERAWALWVLSKQGFASKLDGSWGYDKSTARTSLKVQNAKDQFSQVLSERLESTQIECTNANRIIKSRDTEEAFHFVDPPYVGTNCGHYSGSFGLSDFQDLLDILVGLSGKFMLTMFPHEMLDEYIKQNDWHVVEVRRTISASRTKRRKQSELMVMNYRLNDV